MKLNIGYFYPDELNLYGDTGNVEIIAYRARQRDINPIITKISTKSKIDTSMMKNIDILFMGGGPDSGQKMMYEDLLNEKGSYIKDYIENNGVALFICGSYQLIGKYYKSADGSILHGLAILDFYTEHFGHNKKRCVGNIVCSLSEDILADNVFKNVNNLGEMIVGFENHGGRTYLGKEIKPLARVLFGSGNNGEDGTEGVYYKNTLGTYFHGPFLSKNAHIADYLIAKSLKLDNLKELDDTIIKIAYSALIKRFK